MNSPSFTMVLQSTGYFGPSGKPAPGLTLAGDNLVVNLRAVFTDDRVGLRADAVFSAQNAPTVIFKDAGTSPPSEDDIRVWHEAAWNIAAAPLLWIVTPTDVRLYDCFASPPRSTSEVNNATAPLDRYFIDSEERLRALDASCGRLATETGAFWSSDIGKRIDRRHRVDRELLAEISALERRLTDLAPSIATPRSRSLARDLAQRFIGRCIFTWYLIDRGLAQPFLPKFLPSDLAAMFSTPRNAFALFDWLQSTFNGDLFPMDNPGAEQEHLTPQHLACIRDFIEGRSLIPERDGQSRLFRFRFNAIPIDLISSIYQQFARSAAQEAAANQGLHYTPVELVHLTLDPVFEGLCPNARVVDPACGSGAFLVEAFRRLVWRASDGKPASRELVRKILYQQLYGVDLNRSALGIAAFSLYLAALELDEEPVTDIRDLKFDRLIDETLFHTDSLGDDFPKALTDKSFDAVVGNPPWTFVGMSGQSPKRAKNEEDTLRPRRSPDQAFLRLAARLAGTTGRVGMVMKASPMFSIDVHAVEARNDLLTRLSPAALINLSYLRREELFPDAHGPALIFFSRSALSSGPNRVLVGSIPWTPDFRRTGIFHVGPGEIRSVSLNQVLEIPAFLKAATFGTVRDGWLISRLQESFPTLDEALTALGIKSRINRGQGYKVNGLAQTKTPSDYFDLPVVTPDVFQPFRLNTDELGRLTRKTLHRIRNRSIFKGPLLICSKVGSNAAAQRGRFSAAVFRSDALYTENFTGISFADADETLAYVLNGILNSSVTAFQFALGGPTWGLERPTVLPHELLSLRVPALHRCAPELIKRVADAEARAAEHPNDPTRLEILDEAVCDLYDLEPEERVLTADSIARARFMIFENRNDRCRLVTPPNGDVLRAYAGQVASTINAYLRARGERHVEAIIYMGHLQKADLAASVPGMTAVRFIMAPGRPSAESIVRAGQVSDLTKLSTLLRGQLEAHIPPYLNERRQLRLYGEDDLFILKPTEIRYWTRTAGLNDADFILADHWLRRRDVLAHA